MVNRNHHFRDWPVIKNYWERIKEKSDNTLQINAPLDASDLLFLGVLQYLKRDMMLIKDIFSNVSTDS